MAGPARGSGGSGVLEILEAVAVAGPGVTAQELSGLTGMAPSTTYRLVTGLVNDGYLIRLPSLSGFALGSRLRRIAEVGVAAQPLSRTAAALVDGIRSRIRGGVHVAVYRGGRIDVVDEDPDVPVRRPESVRFDARASALGLLWLDAQDRPPAARARWTVHAAPDAPAASCVAVPLRGPVGELVGGLAVSTSTVRVAAPAALIADLERAARELEVAVS